MTIKNFKKTILATVLLSSMLVNTLTVTEVFADTASLETQALIPNNGNYHLRVPKFMDNNYTYNTDYVGDNVETNANILIHPQKLVSGATSWVHGDLTHQTSYKDSDNITSDDTYEYNKRQVMFVDFDIPLTPGSEYELGSLTFDNPYVNEFANVTYDYINNMIKVRNLRVRKDTEVASFKYKVKVTGDTASYILPNIPFVLRYPQAPNTILKLDDTYNHYASGGFAPDLVVNKKYYTVDVLKLDYNADFTQLDNTYKVGDKVNVDLKITNTTKTNNKMDLQGYMPNIIVAIPKGLSLDYIKVKPSSKLSYLNIQDNTVFIKQMDKNKNKIEENEEWTFTFSFIVVDNKEFNYDLTARLTTPDYLLSELNTSSFVDNTLKTSIKTSLVEIPEVEVPEVEIPEVETPEVEENKPEVEIPEVEIPEVEVPEVEIPEVETPEVEGNKPEVEVETPEVEGNKPEVEVNKPEVEVETPETEVETPEVEENKPETVEEQDVLHKTGAIKNNNLPFLTLLLSFNTLAIVAIKKFIK